MKVLTGYWAAGTTAAVLALSLSLGACGSGDAGGSGPAGFTAVSADKAFDLPAGLVGEDAFAGVYMDLAEMAPASLKVAALDAATRVMAKLEDEQKPDAAALGAQLDTGMADFTASHQAMLDAGVRGVLMVLAAQQGDMEATKTMLIHTGPDLDQAALAAAFSQLRESETYTFDVVDSDWVHAYDTAGNLSSALPAAGSADAAQALGASLNTHAGGIRFGLRMTPALRAELIKNPQARAPEMADAVGKLAKMTGGAGSVRFGANPSLGMSSRFASAEEAEAARAALSDLMIGAKLKFKGQLAQMPGDGPPSEAVDGFFATLEPVADGDQLGWTLGAATLDAAGELTPTMGPLIGKFMMGVMAGGSF